MDSRRNKVENIITYWNNCSFSNKGSFNIPPWILEYNKFKGYYSKSNYNYSLGDLILKERPISYCEGWFPFTVKQINDINVNVNLLNNNDKNEFLKMSNVFLEYDRYVGIYMTNSFDMVGSEVPSCGMYLVSILLLVYYFIIKD